MAAPSSTAVLDGITDALPEVAGLADAHAAAVYLERTERHLLELVSAWNSGDVLDPPESIRMDDDTLPEIRDRLMSESHVIDNTQNPLNERVAENMDLYGLGTLLWVPFLSGRQRGFVALVRSDYQPWPEIATIVIQRVGAVIGRALQMSRMEQLLSLTYERGPIGFALRTVDGALVDCNTYYLELLGLSRDEAEQRNLFELFHPADAAHLRSLIDDLRTRRTERVRHDVQPMLAGDRVPWLRLHLVMLDVAGSRDDYMLAAVEDVTEAHEQRRQLEYAATHDSLTGVANRAALLDRIGHYAQSHDELPDLLIVDFDRFKLVNDAHGHLAGDRVLQKAVERIVEVVGEDHLVARLGGDEFAILITDATNGELDHLAHRVRVAMETPIEIDGRVTRQTVSIGVAVGKDCADATELLVRADRAMYAAKAKGRNHHVIFDQSMRDEALSRIATERELQAAIDRGELEVHFQPEFDTRATARDPWAPRRCIRWRPSRTTALRHRSGVHRGRRADCGLVEEIGPLRAPPVRMRAVRAAVRRPPATSARSEAASEHLGHPNSRAPSYPTWCRQAIDRLGSRCRRTAVPRDDRDDPDGVAPTSCPHDLRPACERIGVEFAIDDFGTGYSSLTYLKRLPVDALKIDRSFVDDIATNTDSRAIVESIMGLASALSLDVVAEGIETEEQLQLLHGLGCRRGQGWLVSAAIPAEELAALLTD